MMAALYFIRKLLRAMLEASFRHCLCLVSKNLSRSRTPIFTKVKANFHLTGVGSPTSRMSLERIKYGCKTFHPQQVNRWFPLMEVASRNGGGMEKNCFMLHRTQNSWSYR